MERIIEHVEYLLFRHDCVIIPDLGGFVLQYIPALYSIEEHSFIPPRKDIVFNQTLTYNDGLLSEIYMQKYSLDFDKAQQLVKDDVSELKMILKDGVGFQFGSIGHFVKEEGRLVFIPSDEGRTLFCTSSYGLPIFHYLPVCARKPISTTVAAVRVSEKDDTLIASRKNKKNGRNIIYFPITRTFIRTVVAAAAAILLFLLISTPVKDVNKASYSASFIPQDMMPKNFYEKEISAESSSLPEASDVSNSVSESNPIATNGVKPETDKIVTVDAKSEVKNETENKNKKSVSSKTESIKYYAIIGSFETRTQANGFIKRLKDIDTSNVGIVVKDGHVRVYAQYFSTETSALSYVDKIRQKPKHGQAWVYKGK